MKYVDNAIAARVIYLLVTPFDQWPAFKEGIIDAEGHVMQPTVKSDNWTMLHRLVSRLKILLGKIPGGSTQIASVAAAYLLVKEGLNESYSDEDLEYVWFKMHEEKWITDSHPLSIELKSLFEDDAPANNITNVAGIKPGDEPPGKKKKVKNVYSSKIISR